MLNKAKYQLMTDLAGDRLFSGEGSAPLESRLTVKYLSQSIGVYGKAIITLSSETKGKLKSEIRKMKNLSSAVKVKFFKLYMRSKIKHMLPAIAPAGGAGNSARIFRKQKFNLVLGRNTTPRESAKALY